ncbi:GyrI-like domain-containing protein [Actinokineospora auranticolor]|uniref:Effector-binding domain-containing protein n=1 Tax=Actinokineospora auranticolor TaxID=155976 RepID=A0A2S6GQI8_9PSEU|nr:GyrI-like domain-containing protein [Actinokineospora auranticolor]PPK67456.1 effector-binding domain-containing protein [Actinokineospora auranticolor]
MEPILEPALETRPEQPYVSIAIEAPLSEWGKVNALVPEVFDWLARRGVPPVGALFYRYHSVADDVLSVEVGVPVATPQEGDGRVRAGSKPAGTYAVLVHEGHPDRIRDTFAKLDDWAHREGVEWDLVDGVWAGRFESYLTDPAEEPDLGKWRTEVAYRVVG